MSSIRLFFVFVFLFVLSQEAVSGQQLELQNGNRIAIIGNTLADRMQHDGWFEAYLQQRFPEKKLIVRNLGFSCDTLKIRQRNAKFGSPDERLAEVKADVVLMMFGFNESFGGAEKVKEFRADLVETIDSMSAQKYSGETAPKLVLVSPVAHENLRNPNLPDGAENNERLRMYRNVMQSVAAEKKLPFVDLFTPSLMAYQKAEAPLTINGVHLNEAGNRIAGKLMVDSLFGVESSEREIAIDAIVQAVRDKNFHWYNYYRTVDGYSMYGLRADLTFTNGQTNREVMRRELDILLQMVANRDAAVWAAAKGEQYVVDDSNTPDFIPVISNKKGSNPDGTYKFPSGEEAVSKMKVLDGFQVNLFASEEDFPELINPVQMSFDSKGRLWVATWASYPHWKPKTKMDDRLLILEDTNGDGVADDCKTFVGGLHNPTGFEFWNGGVVVGTAPEILFFRDNDGDDKADEKVKLLHGFDTADTHHGANSFVFGPGGGIYFQEGIFQFSQVETPYGPVRNKDAAVYRFDPRTARLEVYANHPFVNPHGHVFNQWGQDIILDGTMSVPYDGALASGYMPWPKKRKRAPAVYQPRTRPCPACEIVSSAHFGNEYQNELLVQNVIGDVGILRYRVSRDGASFSAKEQEPLLLSDDPTFRPVDMEFGPQGELFFVDWCNPIIGHMQHNLRDPNRDQKHGRVYRVTRKNRGLANSPRIDNASVEELLRVLEYPVERVRYRARIELSSRDTDEVVKALEKWVAANRGDSAQRKHDLLEALWVYQQHNTLNLPLLDRLLASDDHRVRAAATRVLSHWRYLLEDTDGAFASRVLKMGSDIDTRVRLEAARAASFLSPKDGLPVLVAVRGKPCDRFLDYAVEQTIAAWPANWKDVMVTENALAGANRQSADWFLNKLDVAKVKQLPIDGTVGRHLLLRTDVGIESRIMATQKVSEVESLKPIDVLVETLATATATHPTRKTTLELIRILAQRSPKELMSVRDKLVVMAKDGEIPVVRQIGMAGLMIADGGPEKVWATAKDAEQELDFIRSLSMISDPGMQVKVYDVLKPVALGADGNGNAEVTIPAKYVRIELPGGNRTLTLSEVQVFSNLKNVALGGVASQSSTEFEAAASRAIDGGTSGEFRSKQLTHTSTSSNPWWEVALANPAVIERIVVFNRIEGQLGDRLDGFRLLVLDEARNILFEQQNIPAPKVSCNIEVTTMSRAEKLQRAALGVLAGVRGKESENAKVLADLIVNDRLTSTAVEALDRIPGKYWPVDKAPAIVDRMMEKIRAVPADKRNEPACVRMIKIARATSELLPARKALTVRSELNSLGVRVVAIGTIPHRMAFDQEKVVVKAGQPVEFVFSNTDMMPHNFVITAPGELETVGVLAENGGTKLANATKPFVPSTDKVLAATGLVQPSQDTRIIFDTPNVPGVYPYVCTYPGHWRRMYGAIMVVVDPTAYEAAPAEYLAAKGINIKDQLLSVKRTTTEWKLKDFQANFDTEMAEGRNFKNGKQMFKLASCISCHQINGEGVNIGQNLEELNPEYKPIDVLRHILQPSDKIDPKYQTQRFEMETGEMISGVVTFEDNLMIRYIDNPLAGGDTKVIRVKDIEDRAVSKVSIMPTGLLDQLTRDEVLDLVAFVMAKGKKDHELYESRHDH
jgi:putative heme-binding domain-containing protein